MEKQVPDRRIVIVAVLATLLIWMLSLGSGAAASPASANQTIPTFTPTGQAQPTGLPTTPEPTRPQSGPQETEPPPPEPGTASATPSATLRSEENRPVDTATPVPGASGSASSPTAPAAATSLPGESATSSTSAAGEPTSTVASAGSSTAGGEAAPLPGNSRGGEAVVAGGPSGSVTAGVLLTAPCMWLSLGLVLMAAGSAVLIGQRRRR
jgi:hypothetical protein